MRNSGNSLISGFYMFIHVYTQNKEKIFFKILEVLRLIIRHNIGQISEANSLLLLLGQCRHLHQSSAGPTTVAFVDCLNLTTSNRNLAQYRPYTKPIFTFTMASSYESRRARVRLMDGTLLGHVSLLPR